MAMPATHIRFAVSVANDLPVADMAAYLSGTVYPDSRWLTGVDRKQTHARRFLDPDFVSDAFTLGWHVHCVCDRIQSTLFDQLLDGLAHMDADTRWIHISAAKVVQDMRDASLADLDAKLSLLVHASTPNSESKEQVAAYLSVVRRAYRNRKQPTWPVYSRLWRDVGLDRLRIAAIEKQVLLTMGNQTLAKQLHGAFNHMLSRWRDEWQLPHRHRQRAVLSKQQDVHGAVVRRDNLES